MADFHNTTAEHVMSALLNLDAHHRVDAWNCTVLIVNGETMLRPELVTVIGMPQPGHKSMSIMDWRPLVPPLWCNVRARVWREPGVYEELDVLSKSIVATYADDHGIKLDVQNAIDAADFKVSSHG